MATRKTKTSSAVKNRYNAKAYDRLAIVVPIGRKADCDAYAAAHGTTLNGLVNQILQETLAMSTEEWKRKEDTGED